MTDAIQNGEVGSSVRAKLNENFVDVSALKAASALSFDTVAALLADSTLTYTTAPAGTIVEAGGFRYAVAASAATDHHVTTAGGVKLYVQAGEKGYSVKAFGSVGDGAANDTSAFQRAAASGFHIFVPRGVYSLTTNVTGLWEFENNATFNGAGLALKTFRLITRGTEASNTRGFDHFHRFQGSIPTGSANFGHNSVLVDDITTSGDKLVAGTMFQHTIRAGVQGTRYSLQSYMQVVGTKLDGGYQADVSQASYAWSIANQNGTGTPGFTTPDTSYKGELFGGNDNAWLGSGATFYRNLIGREINVSIFAGASSYSVVGLLIAGKSSQLALEDHAMVGLTAQNQAFKHGISFGLTWGEGADNGWPIRADGTLIGVTRKKYPEVPVGGYGAAYGIDFREATFSTAAFASNGFQVGPSGAVSVGGSQVIAARRTGWVAPTGTATRTSFDTATATTAQLAERVKGLIDDLTAHGLIGP